MVHIPEQFAYDYWQKEPTSNQVEITCLLPNGIVILHQIYRNATISEFKEEIWEKAEKEFPLFHHLRDVSTYMFTCVNNKGETRELRNERERISEAKPFCSVLRLVDYIELGAEKEINLQISSLLGKGIHEFSALNNPEVNDFRVKMKMLGLEVAKERQSKTWQEKLAYHFPPRLAPTSDIPPNCQSRLADGGFLISILSPHLQKSSKVAATYKWTPLQLMTDVLVKKAKHRSYGDKPKDYVLKVCGQEEYLVGDAPLIQFLYIQESLSRDVIPSLKLVSKSELPVAMEDIYENMDVDPRTRHSSTLRKKEKEKAVCAWSVDDFFSFTVDTVSRLNTDVNRAVEIGVQAGLFHGGKPLCESRKTSEKAVVEGTVNIAEELQFDLQVRNIPRMARICLAVYEVAKSSKAFKSKKPRESGKQDMYINPLAWVNTTVYDFRSQLKNGVVTLYMWTYAGDYQSEDLLQSLGSVTVNHNVDHATFLSLKFRSYQDSTITYPHLEAILRFADDHADSNSLTLPSPDTLVRLDEIRQMVDCDPLYEMHEQEVKEMWGLRYLILRDAQTLLPKFLESVEWSDHKQVAETISLVQKWPMLPVEKALELLDYAYAEQQVRRYAVRCLQDVSDEELSLYLLQLVQAIKHESYLSCDLVEFLLRRALNNRTIGHYLFWHLRSEMSFPYVSVRFGLILEAYCRGSLEHMSLLKRQLGCLEKLKETSEGLRQRRDREKARQWMQEQFQEPHSAAAMQDVVNPLNPRFKLKAVRVEKCRVMDSKMRPLYVVMENFDQFGEDVYIIFKNGDDLRQDMLALQMIRIMDMLWKNEGLDLRMNPYGCISTDYRVGLIEVVLNAETIANIQKEKGLFTATAAFNKEALLAWLKDHNKEENQLLTAIEEFTLSCAGYCVATYVLGVADRHSDNIMIKRNGQLFHIDFGHILGHFKEKFGIRRERVPFVLTHDFVYVINKGQKDKKEPLEFQIFQNHCEKAYLILRKHGGLILSLFAMMISTGLPELSSEKDLNYLRETLQLDQTDVNALEHFRGKLTEALANSWKTSLNWASHNLAKNNKT